MLDENGWRSARVRVDVPLVINGHDGSTAIDLSDSGMYVYTRHTIVEGSIVNLNFTLDGTEIELSAKVEHTQQGVGFGLSFLDMPEAVAKMLKDFIKKAEADGRALPVKGPLNQP